MVILCGGKGMRLRPITDTIPKALVTLAGKPIINHIIDKYSEKGINQYLLCIGHKGHMIRAIFKNKSNITFIDSGEDASMLKRIFDTKDYVDENIIVGYCDTIADLDFNDLMNKHKNSGKLLTMVLAEIISPFGIVQHNSNQINSFQEKPVFDYYIGTFVINKKAFQHITPDLLFIESNEGLVNFFQKLVNMKEINSYKYNGKQLTFNTNSEKEAAEKGIIGFYTMREENEDNNNGN